MNLSLLRGAAARAGLAMACVWAAGLAAAAPAPAGTDAVLSGRAQPAARPERAMLMGIARAGDRLVAVGEHGVVALSDNHGRDWRLAAEVPADVTLTAVRFANARRGWAIGHLGLVLRTDDGGDRWVKQLDGLSIAKIAQAQTDPPVAPDAARRLVEEGPDKPLLDLLVQDPQQVTVIGAYNLALATSNGGQAWRLVSEQFDNPGHMHLYGLAATPAGRVAVGEQGLVLREQADRLKALKSPYDGSLFGLLASGDTLLVFGLRGNAFVSRDGGASWKASLLPGSGASINAGLRLSDGRLLLVDQAGGAFVSADGGERFERLPFAWGAPLTGVVEAADGTLVGSSLAGITRLPRPAAAHAAAAGTGASR
ncbi:MAG TPA: glycosyl hydrolase [Ideonella sp.]|nr:glycosyl hydrolase [Ideonella sp.]